MRESVFGNIIYRKQERKLYLTQSFVGKSGVQNLRTSLEKINRREYVKFPAVIYAQYRGRAKVLQAKLFVLARDCYAFSSTFMPKIRLLSMVFWAETYGLLLA